MGARINFEKSINKGRDKQGLQHFVAEIWADTAADIAGITRFGGTIAETDSVAFIERAGKLCTLSSDGKWYDVKDGSEVTGA